jgi:hypothetical protein
MARITGRPLSGALLYDMWLGAESRDGLRVLPGLLRYIDERKEHAVRWAEALRTYGGEQQFIR